MSAFNLLAQGLVVDLGAPVIDAGLDATQSGVADLIGGYLAWAVALGVAVLAAFALLRYFHSGTCGSELHQGKRAATDEENQLHAQNQSGAFK